jgi:uncharacterized alkaline shock family protein YloU
MITGTTDKTDKSDNNRGGLTVPQTNPSGIAGVTNLSDDVVATIAGLAAQDIDGIAALGKSRWIPFSDVPSRGVGVEVGEIEAAVDVDVVIEYGCDLQRVGQALRERLVSEIKKMANRQVIEVNINVVDVKLPSTSKPKPKAESRVR